MAVIDQFRGIISGVFVLFMKLLGWVLSIGLYILLWVHTETFFSIIASVLKKRIGTQFGLLWTAIGLSLLYNIIWNHFLAMMIKPGGPADLQRVE
jgi:hypothetical protein